MINNPCELKQFVYMTANVKRLMIRPGTSKEVHEALERFENKDYGEYSEKPERADISEFGSYRTSFGSVWVMNFNFFADRKFVTILLPSEYDN